MLSKPRRLGAAALVLLAAGAGPAGAGETAAGRWTPAALASDQ